jgi:predicted heme/steroid binding protein
MMLLTTSIHATEEYAEKTGRDCGFCHLNSSGGGELTEVGSGYFLAMAPLNANDKSAAQSSMNLSRILKLVIGYLHVITAFFWFGTILYVHLILKPAYASKGLPPAEVKVGIVSIIIMAITGTILTFYRVPSWDFFFSSRFGILLFIKIALFLIMVSSAIFVVLVIGPRLKQKKITPLAATGDMTIDELGAFDGKEGRPAYIAYKGTIYNVTQSKMWKNGSHMARHEAGNDLTEILTQAPHDEDKVIPMEVIGKLLTGKAPVKLGHQQVFFFMAYMNLIFVFIITFILALWRWL